MVETAANIWALGPSTEPYEPDKSQIIAWGTWVESFIAALGATGGVVFNNKTSADLDLDHDRNTMAWIVADPVVANNGIYRKLGASGTGSWGRLADLPYSFIVASDTGAGTPNAIQATSSLPISGSALVLLNVFEANTSSPVTVSINGEAALTILTASGEQIKPGDLKAGVVLAGRATGSVFRLIDNFGTQFVTASNTGGTNAISATTPAALPAEAGQALVLLPIAATNTSSPVTVSFNGGAALTMKSNSGVDVVPGGLVAGTILLGYVIGSTFRLVSDQASAAFQAVIEGLLAQAEAAAAIASGSMTTVIDPQFATLAVAETFSPVVAPDFINLAFYDSSQAPGSGARYRKAGSEPSHAGKFFITLADGVTVVWYDIGEAIIKVEMLGAKGDGVTDDAAVLQAAVSIGRPVRGRQGATYKINSIWTLPAHCDIDLIGASVDMSGITGTRHGIVAAGSLASNAGTALSADVAEKSYTASVGSGGVFSVNEDVILSSDDYYAYTGTNVSKGECKRIRSIASNTLTFTTPANDTYTFGAGGGSGRVRRVNWVDGVRIRNLKIIGSGSPTSGERGICLRFCRDFLIENVSVDGQQVYQIEINSCLRGRVLNVNCNGVYYDGSTGSIFYGIAIINCSTDITVIAAKGMRNRHLVVTSAMGAGQGFYGEPCDITSIGCHQVDSQSGAGGRSFAYEIHGFGRNVRFIGCTADGCYAFIKIENGRGAEVSACYVRNYEMSAIIIGDNGQYNREIKIDLTAENYTGGVLAASSAVVNFQGPITNVYQNIDIKVNARSTRDPANTFGIGVYASEGVYRQVQISGVIDAGVNDTGTSNTLCVRLLTNVNGVKIHNLTTIGYRTGVSGVGTDISVRGCNFKRLSAAAASGTAVLLTGDRARVKLNEAENMFVGFSVTGTGGVASENVARSCTTAFSLGTNVDRGNDAL